MQLEIRNVSKIYRNRVQALKNVARTIPPGMYGLLDPNGAGKSTLMRTIATLQQPDTGESTGSAERRSMRERLHEVGRDRALRDRLPSTSRIYLVPDRATDGASGRTPRSGFGLALE
jgi:ABC-type multidrug transport system ATPase subunit